MKYHQLFNSIPDEVFMKKLLACYGLKGFDDISEFSKIDLVEKQNTLQNIKELIPEMTLYYIPCKAKIYILDKSKLNIKRTITILWQFLKLYDFSLQRKERVFMRKKVNYYKICKNSSYSMQLTQDSKVVVFD